MDLQYYCNTNNFAFQKQIEVIQKFSLDDHWTQLGFGTQLNQLVQSNF